MKRVRFSSDKLLAITVLAVVYLVWALIFGMSDTWRLNLSTSIIVVSWIGIIEIILGLYLWKQKTGRWFSLFALFLMFFSVFNFGQSFLWAFNIHGFRGEIGAYSVFGNILNDKNLILRGQLAFIMAFFALNCGALLAWNNTDRRISKSTGDNLRLYSQKDLHTLFIASLIITVIAVPTTIMSITSRLMVSRRLNYHALYYGNVTSDSALRNISDILFLPGLLGMLIGSQYRKSVRRVVYAIFLVYAVVTLFTGDRGEWITKLLILVWAQSYYYKSISRKKMLLYALGCIIAIPLVSAIVSQRNRGINIQNVSQALAPIEYSFMSMLAEFGNTMRVTMIILRDHTVFPYGNSYLMAIPTVLSTDLGKRLFGFDYKQLHTWFSSDYLKLSTGADFSMIAEPIMNFGIYLMPLVMLLLGMVILKLCAMPYKRYRNPLRACIAISIMNTVFKCARSTMWYGLNKILYIWLCLTGMFYLVRLFDKNRKINRFFQKAVRNEKEETDL